MDSFLGRLEETLEEVSTQDLIELSVGALCPCHAPDNPCHLDFKSA